MSEKPIGTQVADLEARVEMLAARLKRLEEFVPWPLVASPVRLPLAPLGGTSVGQAVCAPPDDEPRYYVDPASGSDAPYRTLTERLSQQCQRCGESLAGQNVYVNGPVVAHMRCARRP